MERQGIIAQRLFEGSGLAIPLAGGEADLEAAKKEVRKCYALAAVFIEEEDRIREGMLATEKGAAVVPKVSTPPVDSSKAGPA